MRDRGTGLPGRRRRLALAPGAASAGGLRHAAYYRLQSVLRDHAELASVGRVTLGQSLACVRLRLGCAERRRLVTLREI